MENFISSLGINLGDRMMLILGALLILIIGFIIARIVKGIVIGLFSKTKLDEKIGSKLGTGMRLDTFVAKLLYYIVILYTLMLVLGHLGMDRELEPITNLINGFTNYIPNVVIAGIIGYVGYVLATILSQASGFITERVQGFAEARGVSGGLDWAKLSRQLIFLFIFIPILIAALDALDIKAISEPATDMLRSFITAVPHIIYAAIALGVFYLIGHFLRPIITDLLANLGVDKIVNSLDLDPSTTGNFKLSVFAGNLVFIGLMAFGIIEAADKLELTRISGMLENVIRLSGNVLLGGAILVIGNYISLFVKNSIAQTESNEWVASLARYTVLFIFLALGLSTMGLAENVVNLVFGLTIGAVAVAFALSFGLGGREAAGKYMDKFLNKF